MIILKTCQVFSILFFEEDIFTVVAAVVDMVILARDEGGGLNLTLPDLTGFGVMLSARSRLVGVALFGSWSS